MKHYKLFSVLVLVIAIAFTGCKSEDSPTEPSAPGGSSNASGQPLPKMEGSNGVLATIQYEMAAPVPGFPAIQMQMAFASLAEGADAGAVSVNSNSIATMKTGGKTYYMAPNPSNPTATLSGVNFNGSAHTWTVAGGNGVSAINGSVNSPTNFTLSAPAKDAAVSKNGFQATWSGGTSSKVFVVISQVSNGKTFSKEALSDNGNYSFTSSDLSGISGQALLQVVKYNYNKVSSGGKDYYLIAEIVKSVNVTVN
ncbi:MAG: hypothetical protein RBS48_06445 [Ignavibacteriaceae bacterium]|jgi:hypothetical protein|nr:hypothetical protein [Ignavibacteriaceae bacterium]